MQQEDSQVMKQRMTNQPKFWVIVLAVAFASYLVGFNINPQRDEEVVTQPTTKLTQEQDIDAVKRLNEIDKLIFANAAEVAGLQAESLRVTGSLATKGGSITPSELAIATIQLNEQSTRVGELNAKTQIFIEQRNNLLNELDIE